MQSSCLDVGALNKTKKQTKDVVLFCLLCFLRECKLAAIKKDRARLMRSSFNDWYLHLNDSSSSSSTEISSSHASVSSSPTEISSSPTEVMSDDLETEMRESESRRRRRRRRRIRQRNRRNIITFGGLRRQTMHLLNRRIAEFAQNWQRTLINDQIDDFQRIQPARVRNALDAASDVMGNSHEHLEYCDRLYTALLETVVAWRLRYNAHFEHEQTLARSIMMSGTAQARAPNIVPRTAHTLSVQDSAFWNLERMHSELAIHDVDITNLINFIRGVSGQPASSFD